MSITVIIAHYAPQDGTAQYRGLLKQTIESVRAQKVDFDVEVVVCDDGSAWSASLHGSEGVTQLEQTVVKNHPLLSDLGVDQYILQPDRGKYQRLRLREKAIESARYDKLVFLDDDHPFFKQDSLARFDHYLDQYEFVCGRMIKSHGLPFMYHTTSAQGTTFAFRRQLYYSFGGYPDYMKQHGYRDGLVTLSLVYFELKRRQAGSKLGCFAGEIVTRDLATARNSTRLGDRAQVNAQYLEWYGNTFGVHANKNNPVRNKPLWMDIPLDSRISELRYLPMYYRHTVPARLKRFSELVGSAEGRARIRTRLRSILPAFTL